MAAAVREAADPQLVRPSSLDGLNDDEVEAIGYLVADPLAPRLAIALSSCSRVLRRALAAPLKELEERRAKAEELSAFVGMSCSALTKTRMLCWDNRGLTAAHTETLGMLLATNGLRQLQHLHLGGNEVGDEGVQSLADGLGRRALPLLEAIYLNNNIIGKEGATALAAALSRGALPSLQRLNLSQNKIGDEGLLALAAPLRKLPTLTMLVLDCTEVGDEGVAALVAPGEGVLSKLAELWLFCTRTTDLGCAKLVDAIDGRVMPALSDLILDHVPASAAAQVAVRHALIRASAKHS